MNNLAPIALFVYNRPDHTKQTVEALQNNILAKDSELFIFADAAKNNHTESKVTEVKNYIKTISGFKNVTIIEREKNWGLANSIIDGVTLVIKKYKKVIVLEDDLVTSPYFLQFMNDGLNLYKNEKNVWEIGGYVYPIEYSVKGMSYFSSLTTSWGWATWDDRWKFFDQNPQKLLTTMNKQDIYKFNLDGATDLWSQVVLNAENKLHTWAIFWYATVFLEKGLVLYPYKSIVKNIGHDGTGDNCGNTTGFDTDLLEHPIELSKIDISIDISVKNKVMSFLKKNKSNTLFRIIRKVYKVLTK